MASPWRIEMLGRLRATRGARRLERFATRQTAALLSFVAFHADRRHPREALAELIWPEGEPGAARNRLKQALATLRRNLGKPVFDPDRDSIALAPGALVVDVADFEAALAAARRAGRDGAARRASLERAVAVYGGDLLPGQYYDWVLAERERLRGAFVRALHELAVEHERAGDRARALECAERAVAADPLCEEAHRDVIRIRAGSGERGHALSAYRRLEATLATEVGAAPADETRALAEAIEARRAASGAGGGALAVLVVWSGRGGDALETFGRAGDALARGLEAAAREKVAVAVDAGDPGRDAPHARRILAAAHPGQVLVSERAASLFCRDAGGPASEAVALVRLGPYRVAGVDVSPETLFEARAPDPAPAREFPPPRAAPALAARVPAAIARIFGREVEVAAAGDVLASGARLLTITGLPGIGKTRLAIEIAERARGPFRDAVWFVPIAETARGAAIGRAIEETLGLARADDLAGIVPRSGALLVLDAVERTLPAGASEIAGLLSRVPALRCVVTSRRRVAVAGEHEVPLEPLSLAASLDLFAHRARRASTFTGLAVVDLCHKLEGVPLAIELAAARSAILSPEEMLARGPAPSLRAAVASTVEVLSEPARRLFFRLSVFRGGFTRDSAETVCGEPPEDALAEVADASLVSVEGGPEPRFRMLESVRELARERLGPADTAEAEAAHLAYFLALAERLVPALSGAEQRRALERLAAEHENFRVALDRSTAHEPARAIRLGAALARFWQVRGHAPEGLGRLERALARAPEDAPGRAEALRAAGGLAHVLGERATAERHFRAAFEAFVQAGDRAGAMRTLNDRGVLEWGYGDGEAAERSYDESLRIAREIGDRRAQATLANNLAVVHWGRGERARARACLEESIAIRRESQDRLLEAPALGNLGLIANEGGDRAAAREALAASLAIHESVGDERGAAQTLVHLARVDRDEGDLAAAEARAQAGLALYRKLAVRSGIAYALEVLARIALARGEALRALALGEESLREARVTQDPRRVGEALRAVGDAALARGDLATARARLEESLSIGDDLRETRAATAECRESLGAVARGEGRPVEAASHLRVAAELRDRLQAPAPPREAAALAALRAAIERDRAARPANAVYEDFTVPR